MRLSVDLNKYFSDHRSLAYIFVNKKTMQHIQDVEERITRIFNIDNFCLIQQDHYLPSLEDISILDANSDLCVIPLHQTNCIVPDECVTKKKKKKKKNAKDEFDNNEEEMSEKTRKRKLIEENRVNDNDSELKANKSPDELVRKKSKIDINEDKKSNKNNTNHNNKTVYPKRRETFKEHLDKILIKKDEIINRSPNIVKTIIVSANNLIKPDKNELDLNDSSTDSSSSTTTRNKEEEDDEIIEQPKRRRRRTRTRKRRRIVNNDETIPLTLNDTENITPKLCLPKPTGLHIRFSDDGQNDDKNLITAIQDKQQEIVENGKTVKNADANTIINKINDDFILKQPLVIDISPKLNDLIAFKILRLNDAYTPELSPFIIGKVIAFNSDDKEITFDIKQGLDYCFPPQGKFSLEEDAIDEKTSVHAFKWSDLVDPRLVYP